MYQISIIENSIYNKVSQLSDVSYEPRQDRRADYGSVKTG